MRKANRLLAAAASVAVAAASLFTQASLFTPAAFADGGASVAQASAIDTAEFAAPGFEHRPGVRWWWPGNAASADDLIAQAEYLAANGFGMVEIVGFTGSSFLAEPAGETARQVYYAIDGYDEEAVFGWDTPEFYAKMKTVIERCNELGLIVDINMGSGYNANSTLMSLEDSAVTMALGRSTLAGVAAGVAVEGVAVPAAEPGALFGTEAQGGVMGEWDASLATLNAVVVARILGEGAALTSRNQTLDFSDPNAPTIAKEYTVQKQLDFENALVFEGAGLASGVLPAFAPAEAGDYEVVALYSVPNGNTGLQSFWRNEVTGKRNYVIDHLDADTVRKYVDAWLTGPGMAEIVEETDIRAAFNDSYEFWVDKFYNNRVYELAKEAAEPDGLLGYDVTRFIPGLYRQFGEVAPYGSTFVPGFDSLTGDNELKVGGRSQDYFTSALPADAFARVSYDYNQLVSQAFMEGMQAFSDGMADYNGDGILYRQQAYNPPIDTILASKYVDIPEGEQENENSLRRVASGAHIYGKNLVTAEQYTLGNVPFNVTPQKMKLGFDLMAVSGVNNFFYHGLSADYFGSGEEPEGYFTEEGWRAWPTIGCEMDGSDRMSSYYMSMNMYAARANYAMAQGEPSADVAVYMPLFGSAVSSAAGPITTLNRNGLAWDAINDACITDELAWVGGKLRTAAGMEYDALMVYTQTLPVKTMQALSALADAGAPIVFCGELPNRQPSYCGGDYEAQDAAVAAIAAAMIGKAGVRHVPELPANDTASDELAAALLGACEPAISFEQADDSDLRLARRVLDDGGELAYIRNSNAAESRDVAIKVADGFANAYWLDQMTGKIYAASVVGGKIEATLDPAGAIILVVEPAGVEIPENALSAGMPAAILEYAAAGVVELAADAFTLTVTADNFNDAGTTTDGVAAGETETRVYEGGVIGNWADAGFMGAELRYVSDAGSYKASFDVQDPLYYQSKRLMLSLGQVNSAATVYVNGALVGQLFSAPYEIDVTDALADGENDLEIVVQPLQHNRRVGFKQAYNADKTANARYLAYNAGVSGNAVSAAGLAGPVALTVAEQPMGLAIAAAERTLFGEDAVFGLSASGMQSVNLIELTLDADGGAVDMASAKLEGLNGFAVFGDEPAWELQDDGTWRCKAVLGILENGATASGDMAVASLSAGAAKLGEACVRIAGAEAFGIDGDGERAESYPRAVNVEPGEAVTKVWSPYDLNGDDTVGFADLSLAFFYYQSREGDANWDAARVADVDGSRAVDMTDLLAIYANFIA